MVEVGLLGRRVEDGGGGDRIDDGSTMDQPKEIEVGRRASSSLERDFMAMYVYLW